MFQLYVLIYIKLVYVRNALFLKILNIFCYIVQNIVKLEWC